MISGSKVWQSNFGNAASQGSQGVFDFTILYPYNNCVTVG